jgi:hypothetical protein
MLQGPRRANLLFVRENIVLWWDMLLLHKGPVGPNHTFARENIVLWKVKLVVHGPGRAKSPYSKTKDSFLRPNSALDWGLLCTFVYLSGE